MRVTASIKPVEPFLIGLAGGSGSGKTYFAKELKKRLGENFCEIVFQDNFYVDQSAQFDHDGGRVNFDHPNAIDFPLLVAKLTSLKRGQAVDVPIYDFATHQRLKNTLKVWPRSLILVDGILLFHCEELRELFDDLIFFDTPEELRFQRRLKRDVAERGRTPEGVRQQFINQVKPMHDQFVEPTKAFAKKVVCETGDLDLILAEYVKRF